jgi:hypothetical protein
LLLLNSDNKVYYKALKEFFHALLIHSPISDNQGLIQLFLSMIDEKFDICSHLDIVRFNIGEKVKMITAICGISKFFIENDINGSTSHPNFKTNKDSNNLVSDVRDSEISLDFI